MISVVFLIQKLLLLLHSIIIQCFFPRVSHNTRFIATTLWQFTSICLFLVLGLKNCFFFSFLHFILLSVAFISIILRFSLPHRENVCEIKTCNDNGHFHEFSLVCGLSIVLSVNLILFLFTYLILYHRSAKQTHTNTPIETPFVVVADLQ